MNDNEFDDMFRKKLQSFESGVPADMWKRITKEKKKHKGGFLILCFFITVFVLFIGLGSTWFFLHKKNDKNVNFDTNIVATMRDKKDVYNDTFNKDTVVKNLYDSNTIQQKNNPINQRFFAEDKKNNRNISSENSRIFTTTDKSFDKTEANNKSKSQSYDSSKNDSLKNKSLNNKDTSQKTSPNEFSENKQLSENPNNDKISLEFYGSPDLPFNNYYAVNNTYKKILKSTGTMQLSFTVGLRVKILISKRVCAKVGIEYSNVKEKIAFTNSINGLDYKTTNSYKFINAPLLISYKTKWLSEFPLSFNAGFIINVSSKYKGAIPSPDRQPINIKNANVYNVNVGLSLYFGIDFSKKINKKTDVFVEPWFKCNMKNMANSFQSFKQKMNSSGVSLGIRYQLFKVKTE